MSMPNIKEFMDATGVDFLTASNLLYGNVGANLDTRDWSAIMESNDKVQAATDALADMYSDPVYQQQNTENLVSKGYDPAQAYYTYGQMNDRVGANYVPSANEIAAVENYFNANVEPGFKWDVPSPGGGAAPSVAAPASAATSAPKRAVATAEAIGGLTPEIAQDLMQRSMTTGVPTSEFDKYGGYQNVKSFYSQNGGSFSLDDLTPEFLNNVDDVIANTGVGNLSVLKKTGTPLTEAGRQGMINNGVNWNPDALKASGIPYVGFLKQGNAPSSVGGTGSNGQLNSGPQVMGPMLPGEGGGWNARQAVGGANGALMGAGNADYHSSLIKSLRQNSLTPFSTNTGVLMAPNMGASSGGNWTQPPGSSGGAFNPQVINPRAASDQEVADWNAYSAYRTNALNAKTPILSMSEWLAGGKSDGKAPIAPPAEYDYSMYGA